MYVYSSYLITHASFLINKYKGILVIISESCRIVHIFGENVYTACHYFYFKILVFIRDACAAQQQLLLSIS